jgi:tetratricopeptide (TPR) repeat protein
MFRNAVKDRWAVKNIAMATSTIKRLTVKMQLPREFALAAVLFVCPTLFGEASVTEADVEATFAEGNAYLKNHEADKAEVAFAHLFGVPANSAAAHLLAAELMLKQDYKEEARTQARKALAIDPKLPGVHFLLGRMADLDEGAAEMGKEIAINPNLSMAWYRLGEILARQEKWTIAISHLERAIWLNGDFSGSYMVLGKCYLKTANYGNAEGVLRHALTIDPNNRVAAALLQQTLAAEGKTQ